MDDNHDVADSEAQLLSVVGFDARACYDAASALAEEIAFRPDVCLIDLNMPGMDGDELAVRLRRQATGRPFLVAVTAVSDVEGRRRIAAAGFDRHLVKPAALSDLIAAIGAAAAG